MAKISELIGKTLTDIKDDADEIVFICDNGDRYKMYHDQDCCEQVTVDDINGSLNDLIGSPITQAKESTNSEDKEGRHLDSFTWTFYNLATVKGYVTIKWLGESNCYYSESVSFIKERKPQTN
jgi:hypothetical protein